MSPNKRKKTKAELREEAIQQQWLKEHINISHFNPERAQGMELDDEAVHVTTSFGPTFGRCSIQIVRYRCALATLMLFKLFIRIGTRNRSVLGHSLVRTD